MWTYRQGNWQSNFSTFLMTTTAIVNAALKFYDQRVKASYLIF